MKWFFEKLMYTALIKMQNLQEHFQFSDKAHGTHLGEFLVDLSKKYIWNPPQRCAFAQV